MNSLTLDGTFNHEIGRLCYALPARDGVKRLTVLVSDEDIADIGRTSHNESALERTLRSHMHQVEQAAQRAYGTTGANERGEVSVSLF